MALSGREWLWSAREREWGHRRRRRRVNQENPPMRIYIVSDEAWPRSERLDGRVWFTAADQCAVGQPQGVSSAIRLLGQLWTSFVSRSVRYVSGLTPRSLHVSISEAGIAQLSAPSSLPANSAFFLLRAIGRIARSIVLESISIRPSSRKRTSPSQRLSA